MEKAVEYARKKGVVVVCAAGNGGRGIVEYPAAYPGSVAVAAVGPSGQRAPYSSWGKELDVAAPGGDKRQGEEAGIIQNTIDPKDVSQAVYASYQGTSMATPHVAGVAALLFAAGAKGPDQVEKALFASAHPPKGATGWTDQYGHGVIDAEAALQALKKLSGVSDDVSELNLTLDRVCHIGAQIADVLALVHAKGIVHRGLDPDAILIVAERTDPDRVKVQDFGLAHVDKSELQDTGPALTQVGERLGRCPQA
jgi:subtilisin family serine protease